MIETVSVQLGELKNAIGSLRQLSDMKLPAKVAFSVSRSLGKIDEELKLYNEALRKAVEENGGVALDNGTIEFESKDNEKLFITELTDLNETTVNIDINKVPIDSLDGVELTPGLFMTLHWLFTD